MTVTVESLLTPSINRPARYLGNEWGALHKSWDNAEVRWALTYPEVYEVGASNLGHIILYNILNAQPRQLCDRAYLPAADLAAQLRQYSLPLFAVESKRSLQDFDILGFSLSYELGATNILEMLDLIQLPLTTQERAEGDRAPWQNGVPLVFAGGQTATSNPEPFADFFDFIALGDGEELLPEIGLVLEEAKQANLGRAATLLDLAQIPGVYVPQFYTMAADGSVHPNRADIPHRVLRRVATPMPAYSIGLVPYVETVHDRLTIEIRRGCTRGCRFCQPGMLTRPARDVDPDQVMHSIEQGMRATGYNEFSLLSLSCSDYLALPAVGMELKNRLKDENISLSLPSQRVDRFDENIANILGGTRPISLTFAPEAGTQRLRDIINKGLTNEELLRGVKTAYDQGWDKVKLYFMIGLPGETDADLLGIAETLHWLQRECRGRRRIHFNVTISNFTPKPHTPFQWHSVSASEFSRKQELLRQAFRSVRGLKANFTDVRISAMEDFVGRGDRRLSSVVQRAWELGAREDSWWESVERAYGAWTQAIDESELTWKYRQVEQGEWDLFSSPAPESSSPESSSPESSSTASTPASGPPSQTPRFPTLHPLPWDHLDTGIEKQWLLDDLRRALEAATVPDCSFEGCSHCGVCGVDFGHNVVVPPPPIPTFVGHGQPSKVVAQRLRVRFGKQGTMTLVSHLDLMRLFDRAVRRAALPISFSGGYHPSPRIIPANALSLGWSSSGELADFELTQPMAIAEFQARLGAQLPADLPLYTVEEVAPQEASLTQRLTEASYLIHVALMAPEGIPSDEGTISNAAISNAAISNAAIDTRARRDCAAGDWANWVALVLAQGEFWTERTTKSGKVQVINLRDRLLDLAIASPEQAQLAGFPPEDIITPQTCILQYRGSCRNDGTLLRPEQVLHMLGIVSGLRPLPNPEPNPEQPSPEQHNPEQHNPKSIAATSADPNTLANPGGLLQLLHAHRLSLGLDTPV